MTDVHSSNNFDFLRLLAATLVIYHHCNPILGIYDIPYRTHLFVDSYGNLGVSIFFVISGYLVTGSWLKTKTPAQFFKNRALRIMPALTVAVIATAFLIGPVFTRLSTGDYLSHVDTWGYLQSILIYPMKFHLPAVFTENIYGVNGPLWSLPLEVTAYIFLAILGMAGLVRIEVIGIILLCLVFYFTLAIPAASSELFLGMMTYYLLRFLCLFLGGSLLYLLGRKVSYNWPIFFLVFTTMAGACSATLGTVWAMFFFTLLFPYLVICFAHLKIPQLNNFGRYGDFSYGLYIYGFPVQQAYFHLFTGSFHIWTFFAASFLTTLAIAALSWHYIEKPALSFKNRHLFRRTENIATA